MFDAILCALPKCACVYNEVIPKGTGCVGIHIRVALATTKLNFLCQLLPKVPVVFEITTDGCSNGILEQDSPVY